MNCEHTHIQTWRFKDTGDSAQMWSCVACAEKFLPITQALAESRKRAEDMRERAAKDWEDRHGFDKHGVAAAIRELPVDPTLPTE